MVYWRCNEKSSRKDWTFKNKKHEIDVLVDEILLIDFKGKGPARHCFITSGQIGDGRRGESDSARRWSLGLVRIVLSNEKGDIKDFIMSTASPARMMVSILK